MPYTMGNLPDNIKKLDVKKQRRWMEIFNSSMAKHKDEAKAFSIANGVIKEGSMFDLKEQAPSGSFEYIREEIQQALNDQYDIIFPGTASYDCYLCYVYPESIIVSCKQDYYQVPYQMDMNSNVTFGAPVEVEQYFAPKDIQEKTATMKNMKVITGSEITKEHVGLMAVVKDNNEDKGKKGCINIYHGDKKIGVMCNGEVKYYPSSALNVYAPADAATPTGPESAYFRSEIKESGIELTKESVEMDFDFDTFTIREDSYNDETGEVEVILIEAGTNPYKKRHYPKSTIQEAAPLFKGLKMYMNHPTVKEEAERPERNLRDWVSTITESWYDNGKAMAKVAVHESWLRERLADKVAREHIGLSINAGGKIAYGKVDGEEMQIVEKILVNRQNGPASVDWVTEAGARGRVSRLIKENNIREDISMDKTLKEATIEDLQRENPKLLESITNHVRETIQKSNEVNKRDQELKEAQEKVADLEKKNKLNDQKEKVTSWLKEGVLPEATKDRIVGEFTAKVFGSEKELKESFDVRVKEEREYLNKISIKGKIKLGEGSSNDQQGTLKETISTRLEQRIGFKEETKKEEIQK